MQALEKKKTLLSQYKWYYFVLFAISFFIFVLIQELGDIQQVTNRWKWGLMCVLGWLYTWPDLHNCQTDERIIATIHSKVWCSKHQESHKLVRCIGLFYWMSYYIVYSLCFCCVWPFLWKQQSSRIKCKMLIWFNFQKN